MILSDRDIQDALRRRAISILPDPTGEPDLWSSTSLDLRLDGRLTLWRTFPPEANLTLTPGEFNFARVLADYTEAIDIPEAGYRLQPNTFLLGWTLERIKLPEGSRIAARVEGKSSLARLGVGVHVTAPTVHAGFGYNTRTPDDEGQPIQLEIWAIGTLPIMLKKGMKICQLIFEEVKETPSRGYTGMFAVQGPHPLGPIDKEPESAADVRPR